MSMANYFTATCASIVLGFSASNTCSAMLTTYNFDKPAITINQNVTTLPNNIRYVEGNKKISNNSLDEVVNNHFNTSVTEAARDMFGDVRFLNKLEVSQYKEVLKEMGKPTGTNLYDLM
ncbi:MAG: hypothetical protein RR910_01355 [Acidaminococcaceae bacterium]